MVSFSIVSGDYFNDYERFIELYNNPDVSKSELKKELDIGEGTYTTVRKELISKGCISKFKQNSSSRRKFDKKEDFKPKYYSCHNNKGYENHYTINKCGYFGHVVGEDNAREIVKRMIDCDWDRSQFERIKSEVLSK